jgi:hypothetical protein
MEYILNPESIQHYYDNYKDTKNKIDTLPEVIKESVYPLMVEFLEMFPDMMSTTDKPLVFLPTGDDKRSAGSIMFIVGPPMSKTEVMVVFKVGITQKNGEIEASVMCFCLEHDKLDMLKPKWNA